MSTFITLQQSAEPVANPHFTFTFLCLRAAVHTTLIPPFDLTFRLFHRASIVLLRWVSASVLLDVNFIPIHFKSTSVLHSKIAVVKIRQNSASNVGMNFALTCIKFLIMSVRVRPAVRRILSVNENVCVICITLMVIMPAVSVAR